MCVKHLTHFLVSSYFNLPNNKYHFFYTRSYKYLPRKTLVDPAWKALEAFLISKMFGVGNFEPETFLNIIAMTIEIIIT